jgi:hypothetical protein
VDKLRAAIIARKFRRRQEAGGRRQEAGGRRQEAGGRRQDMKIFYPFTVKSLLPFDQLSELSPNSFPNSVCANK